MLSRAASTVNCNMKSRPTATLADIFSTVATSCGINHGDECLGGVQVAILAGDFLLARASVSLAALRNSDVIQLLSQVIEDLVSGEIMQVTKPPPPFPHCPPGCIAPTCSTHSVVVRR